MQHSGASDVPVWLSYVLGAGGFIGTAIGAILAGKKWGHASETTGQATVLAGSITDSRQVERIIDAVANIKEEMRDAREQRHRDSQREIDAIESLTRALRENSDAHRTGGLTPEMIALVARMGK